MALTERNGSDDVMTSTRLYKRGNQTQVTNIVAAVFLHDSHYRKACVVCRYLT